MIIERHDKSASETLTLNKKPKIGFLGVGWIGKHRLEAIRNSTLADVVALCDPYAADTDAYCESNKFKNTGIYEELLNDDLDGIVIATPSALHKQQSIDALKHGKAVFCQKPLACSWQETKEVIDVARHQNLLLMTDMSYRYTEGLEKIKEVISSGELGDVYAAHLSFHNAYGPDKTWYYTPSLSGGGCIMDLGVHLVDALFWIFPDLETKQVNSKLFAKGTPIKNPRSEVEDYGMVQIEYNNHLTAQVACSWNLSAGRDAIIDFTFYGTQGGASFTNVNGSFYDFKAELFKGTKKEVLSMPPDEWGGRAAVHWATQLAEDNTYRNDADIYLKTAKTLDLIYGR